MLDALHPVLARTLDVHHLAPNHHGPGVDGSWTLRRLFPGGRVGAGDFVVLNACRNQPRKRIDLTLDGFSRLRARQAGRRADDGFRRGLELTTFEHAATRAAQVVPRHTAFAEL